MAKMKKMDALGWSRVAPIVAMKYAIWLKFLLIVLEGLECVVWVTYGCSLAFAHIERETTLFAYSSGDKFLELGDAIKNLKLLSNTASGWRWPRIELSRGSDEWIPHDSRGGIRHMYLRKGARLIEEYVYYNTADYKSRNTRNGTRIASLFGEHRDWAGRSAFPLCNYGGMRKWDWSGLRGIHLVRNSCEWLSFSGYIVKVSPDKRAGRNARCEFWYGDCWCRLWGDLKLWTGNIHWFWHLLEKELRRISLIFKEPVLSIDNIGAWKVNCSLIGQLEVR